MKCVVCKREFEGPGCNPWPMYDGNENAWCCHWCDLNIVGPVRMWVDKQLREREDSEAPKIYEVVK